MLEENGTQEAETHSVQPSRLTPLILAVFAPIAVWAGGPKYVAGSSYFDPAVLGKPVHWAGGVVNYYVDMGPLNGQIANQQAIAMVDAAASLWNAVPTAGVVLTLTGSLSEDVSGANVIPGSPVWNNPVFCSACRFNSLRHGFSARRHF